MEILSRKLFMSVSKERTFYCTVFHEKSLMWLYKRANKMHFLYVFILPFLYNSTCFERPFRSSSGVHGLLYLQLCTNRANVSNCLVVRFQRNGRSKHVELYKNGRINTYRKCILLVCLHNWL